MLGSRAAYRRVTLAWAAMDLKTREGRRQQGELIKAAAAAAGLTLKELATRLGVSHALIYQYVSGANLAQPDKLQEIAQLTGAPVSYFFGESPFAEGTSRGAPAAGASAVAAEITPPAAPPIDAARVQQNLRQLDVLAQAQDLHGRDIPGLIRTLEQMLGLARLMGDRAREAELLFRIGNARTDAGDLKNASDALAESAALFRDLGSEERALSSIQSLARCRSLMGQTSEAEALFQEVAASDNPDLAWRGLLGMGQIREQLDDYEDALRRYEQAREVVDGPSGERLAAPVRPIAELFIGMNLGNVYMAEGDFATAAPLWQVNMDRSEDLSQPDQFLEALLSDAVCQLYLGRPGAACGSLRRGIRFCRLLGDSERLGVARAYLAETLALAGLAEESKEEAREAAKLAGETASSRGASLANLAMARGLIVSGQPEGALFYLESEVRSTSPKTRAAALLLRSELWRRQDRQAGAIEDARAAIAAVQRAGANHLLKASAAALAAAAAKQVDADLLEAALSQSATFDRFTPGLPDTSWQLAAARGRAAELRGDVSGAAESLAEAAGYIRGLRRNFAEHGVLDAMLDDEEKLGVYREALSAARAAGRDDLRERILSEADWPPLAEEDARGPGS